MPTRIDVIGCTADVTPGLVDDHTVIVVDTLRATSTVAALLAGGLLSIYPVATIEEALDLRRVLGPETLLCGERGGLPPMGFDRGNSPVEIEQSDVAGRVAVLTTSNGTLALRAAWERTPGLNAAVVTAAIVNARAALEAAVTFGRDVAVLCAGEQGGTIATEEDLYTAGVIARLALDRGAMLTPAATRATALVELEPDPVRALPGFPHAKQLAGLGLGADVDWCARQDALDIVPLLTQDNSGRPCLVSVR